MDVLDAADADPQEPSPDAVDDLEAIRRATALLEEGEVAAARKVVEGALDASRPGTGLLWVLADIEFAEGDPQAGMKRLADAAGVDVQDAGTISRRIRALSSNRLWREALFTIEHIPARARDDPMVREAVGDFYKARWCQAHAVSAYGKRKGLSSAARIRRLVSWLYSGGPFKPFRRRIAAWEESTLLTRLRVGRRASEQLVRIPELTDSELFRLNVLIDSVIYEWRQIVESFQATMRKMMWLAPTGCLPVWLVTYLTVKEAAFIAGPGGPGAGSFVSAVVATAGAVLLMLLLVRKDLTPRISVLVTPLAFLTVCIIAIIAESAAGAAYNSHVLPTTGWLGWVVFGLFVLPAVFFCMAVIAVIMNMLTWRKIKILFQDYCQIVLLDTLLAILHGLQVSPRRHEVAWRLQWAQQLDFCARRVRKDLLPASFLKGNSTADWLRRRAVGWAEAFYQLQREIVAPVPGRQQKLESSLRHQVRCLATGDLGALAWRQPPPSPPSATTWRRAAAVTRTILVAGLPLTVVLAGHSLVDLSEGTFRWTGILTAVWALLYIVICLDPAIQDKIETARGLVGTVRDIQGIGPRGTRD